MSLRYFSVLALTSFSLVQALSASYQYSSAYGAVPSPSIVEIWEPDVTVTEHLTTTVHKACSDCQTGVPGQSPHELAVDQVTSSLAEAWSYSTAPPVTTTLVPSSHWNHDAANPKVLIPDHAVQIYYAPPGKGDSSTAHQFQWINMTLSSAATNLDQSRLITYTWSSATNTLSVKFSTEEAFDAAKSSWSISDILIAHVEGCGDYEQGDSCYIPIDTLSFSSTSFSCEVTGRTQALTEHLTSMKASWGTYTPLEDAAKPAKPVIPYFDPNFSAHAMSAFSSAYSKYVTFSSTKSSSYSLPTSYNHESFTKPSGWDYIPAGAAYNTYAYNYTGSWSDWAATSGSPVLTTPRPHDATTASDPTQTSIAESSKEKDSTGTTGTGIPYGGNPSSITTTSTTFAPTGSLSSVVSSLSSIYSSLAANYNNGASNGTISTNGSSPFGATVPLNSTNSLNITNPANNNGFVTDSASITTGSGTTPVNDSGTPTSIVSPTGFGHTNNSSNNGSYADSPSPNIDNTLNSTESNCAKGVDPIFGLPTTCIGPTFDLDLDSIDGFLTLDHTDFAAIVDLFPGLITASVLSKTKRAAHLSKRCAWYDLPCLADEAADAIASKARELAAAAAAEAQRLADLAQQALEEAARKAEEEAKAAAAAAAAALEAAKAEAERLAEEAKEAAEAAANEAIRLAKEAAEAAEEAARKIADGIVAAANAAGQGISEAAGSVIADIVKGINTPVGFEKSTTFPISISPANSIPSIDSPWGKQPPVFMYGKSATNQDEDKDHAAADKDDENKAKAKAGIILYCVDCAITGTVDLEGELEVSLAAGIKTLMIGTKADMEVSLGIGLEANALLSYTITQQLFRQGIPNLCSGTILCIGPYVSFGAELTFKAEAVGHIMVGGKWTFNDAVAELWAYGDGKTNSHGWTPAYEKRFDAGGEIKLSVEYGMPLAIGCGITILNGKWSKNAELSVVPAIEASATIGGHAKSDDLENFDLDAKTEAGCEGVELSLDWNIRLKYNVFDLVTGVLWELGPQNIGNTCIAFNLSDDDGDNPHDPTDPIYNEPAPIDDPSEPVTAPRIVKVKVTDNDDATPLLICNGNVYKQDTSYTGASSGCSSDWLAYDNSPVGAVNIAATSGVGSIVADASLRIPVINRNAITSAGVSRLRLVDNTAIPSKSEYIALDWINGGWAGVDRFGDIYQAIQCKNLNATTAGIQTGLHEIFMVSNSFPEKGLAALAADQVVYSVSNGYVRECKAMALSYVLSAPTIDPPAPSLADSDLTLAGDDTDSTVAEAQIEARKLADNFGSVKFGVLPVGSR